MRAALITAVVASIVLTTRTTTSTASFAAGLLDSQLVEFVCATLPPDWRGGYRATAAAFPDGTPLYFTQDPPLLTADYQGRVTLRDFTVVGERPTIRFYYRTSSAGPFAYDEFSRVLTRVIDGNTVSVFEPSWAMSELLDSTFVVGAGMAVWLDNQAGLSLTYSADDNTPAGQFPSNGRAITLRTRSRSIQPITVTRVSDTIQYSSHIVNLVVPGFGDQRLSRGDNIFPLEDAARLFYSAFEDSYDTLTFIPAYQQFNAFSGFHQNVQNRIEGIGLSVFDNSGRYGSRGVLQGVEYLVVLNNIGIKHEQAHQWGDYFNWSRIGDITVTDTAHTPILADRETPLPGRVAWWLRLAQQDDQWRGVRATFPHMYSPMILDAMGRLDKEQVPSFVVFDNQQQVIGSPGAVAQGTFKTRTVFDAIRVHGERRGPAVGDTLSRAHILVSTQGLVSAEEMAFWTFYSQRAEDPNGTGVRGYSDDGSFDRATGVDLRTDIRPLANDRLPGNRDVDDKRFDRRDLVGITLDDDVATRFPAGSDLTLRGEVSAVVDGTETMTVAVRPYQGTALFQRSVQIGASRRFEITLPFTADQRGVYELDVTLTRANRRTRLAPIVVE
jgi:hypothetical protein